MSSSVELMKRYEVLQENYRSLEQEITRDEAVLEVKKEDVSEKRKELEEMGITFKSVKELKAKKEEIEESIEKQVERMEEILGIESEVSIGGDDDFEEFEEIDI